MKKYTKQLLLFLFFFINSITKLYAQNFENIWYDMQKFYRSSIQNAEAINNSGLIATYWHDGRSVLKKLIEQFPNKNIFSDTFIGQNMIRRGYGKCQMFEEIFLKECISGKTRQIINSYKDHNLLVHESKLFNCSTNTLAHLFYAAKVLEKNKELKTIVELGGGIGSLARIFKNCIPTSTIIIIDLPEVLALQYLFFKLASPELQVYLTADFDEESNNFDRQGIYLVPVNYIEKININSDLFISTFALSETPHQLQKAIVTKNFFNASLCYLVGQIDGWRSLGHTWIENHNFLINSCRNIYSEVTCTPYHIFAEQYQAYEVIAANN